MHDVHMLGVRFDDLPFDEAVSRLREAARGDRTRTVVFPNAATLNLAAQSRDYRDVLNSSSFVFGDGTGVRGPRGCAACGCARTSTAPT
ncbi:hypothetical protein [Tsukamurella pulmonis]|uniref:hypothetical protein n=1 Tax=Tsukamurella pulmonis TaxID=47312 RepID=UPI001113FB70|nr:hypothetical protein [Tsukamurella pulmonis]